MFLKEQKILVKFHNPFPEAKRCLIKRAKSSRRMQERDVIKNILKDPGAVMDPELIECELNALGIIRVWYDGENEEREFINDPWMDDYDVCMCPSCLGTCMLDAGHEE